MTPQVDAVAEGPWFEDFVLGQVFDRAPSVTLTSGSAAVHQSIVGDRLRLPLDEGLATATAGRAPLAHPGLVWDTAIGQSTVATQHVKANLFYRGLVFRTLPRMGDTLRTTTRVVGLRQNEPKPGRAATGLVALRMTTVDQSGTPVLDFVRCAMVALRDSAGDTGASDSMDAIPLPAQVDLGAAVAGWDAAEFRAAGAVPYGAELEEGGRWQVSGGDVVSSAPELARLTLNIANVHHDASQGGRLVYGGHTIGIALAQTCRALPDLATVTAWHSCDHLGPVYEGDTLRSSIQLERIESTRNGWTLLHLRSLVRADPIDGDKERPVLDWRFVAACV